MPGRDQLASRPSAARRCGRSRRRARCGRPRRPRRDPRRRSRPARRGSGARSGAACPPAAVRRTRAAGRCSGGRARGRLRARLRSPGRARARPGRRRRRRRAARPSSFSSGGVNAACTGPRRPSITISSIPAPTIASIASSVVSVERELLGGQRQHPHAVDRDVAVPDHDRARVGEVELELLEVRVAVVPGDERRGRPRARQVLARDAEAAVGLRADGVDDRVVEAQQLLVRDVAADLDVAEEAEAGLARRSSRRRARRP